MGDVKLVNDANQLRDNFVTSLMTDVRKKDGDGNPLINKAEFIEIGHELIDFNKKITEMWIDPSKSDLVSEQKNKLIDVYNKFKADDYKYTGNSQSIRLDEENKTMRQHGSSDEFNRLEKYYLYLIGESAFAITDEEVKAYLSSDS